MYSHTLFCDLMKVLPCWKYDRIVERVCGGEKVPDLSHWSHLVALIYGQLCGHGRLRGLVAGLGQHRSEHYHLGIGEVKRSTLPSANSRRNVAAFSAVLQHLIGVAGGLKGSGGAEIVRECQAEGESILSGFHNLDRHIKHFLVLEDFASTSIFLFI